MLKYIDGGVCAAQGFRAAGIHVGVKTHAAWKKDVALIVSDVEMLDEGLERGAYRHSTQGWMKPCKPLPQFLKEFSLAGGTHHSALVYDANIEEIKAFGTMMGFEVIEIK